MKKFIFFTFVITLSVIGALHFVPQIVDSFVLHPGSGGTGDVESVGDCTGGDCGDGSSDGGTYVRLYDGTGNYFQVGVSGALGSDTTYNLDSTFLTTANPTFTGTLTIGSAGLSETELEILDDATLTTTQINYLASATGTTGTTNTNVVFSTSPTLVTPILGAATGTSLTLDASAAPQSVFRDSDNAGTDKEIAKMYANATTITDGAEDGEWYAQVMDSGSEKTVFHADGDTGAEHVEVGPSDCTYDMHVYYSINAVNDTYSGTITTMTVDSGVTSVYGQALHVDTDGELILADGDVASSGAAPCIGLALEAGTGAKKILLHGFITETDWDWQTIGGPIYLSDDPTTTEGLTETAISTEADTVQILGIVISADTIYFNPSLAMAIVPAA